ncbi:hypothetical protein Rhopal_002087-T1 [Rhodotorula paludigena]|uniref:Zn(2)-C6 fungal-type domain-containing protein n=1 Tax=Rhodotorula paludigena TaxID=86838 RepID=A0AAV5GG21_9BASI|nr:hypothetical protein Rhopal_002087-T1 [Rhodotorula paludigena]
MDPAQAQRAVPASLDLSDHAASAIAPGSALSSTSPAASAAHSPSTAHSKRKAGDADGTGRSAKSKGKAREQDRLEGDDDSDDGATSGQPRKKRNRVALSCAECKRRKIKCDRVMPVCGNCTKRGRPNECSWDVFQPSNDAFLPPTIARTAEVDSLAARLAHVEKYLATLPPNFALFRPLAPQLVTSAAASAPRRAVTAGEGGRQQDGEDGFSDTEDAAVKLEYGVFAPRPDPPASSTKPAAHSARPALAHAPSSTGPSTRLSNVRFGAPQLELTKALTSIVVPAPAPAPSSSLRAHLLVDFDAPPEEVAGARQRELERILRTLPGREATAFLVERYFTSVAWLFHHLHAPSFRAELDAFHALCDASRTSELDPSWLALLLMVLCLALDSMHYSRSPLALGASSTPREGGGEGAASPLEHFSKEQREALPERWFEASMRALRLAEWEKVPRIRSIQTIVLYTQYLQLSSAARGQPTQLVIWLASGIRLAQMLNLHLLGSNPETMPPEDPAFPPGKNSLKREMAKRLWAVLVYQDWLAANARNRCYLISPMHCDTDDPLNVNDADLSPSTTTLAPVPSSVLTDSSADRVRIATARQVRAVFDRTVLVRDYSYETIIDLDAGFRVILDELPERWTLAADEQEAPMLRFQRHFVLEGLHNRIFRLHRPLLSKAHKNPKYKFSADACLKSARAVVVSTHNIREAVSDVPYTYSHVLGAALVLFNDLFQAIDHESSGAEIDSKIETLQLALEIFQSKPSSTPLALVVQQGHRILAGLFREEERRRTNHAARALMLAAAGGGDAGSGEGGEGGAPAEEAETFAEVLQRIARSLDTDSAPHRGTPPPTRNLPSMKAKKGAGPAATGPPYYAAAGEPASEAGVMSGEAGPTLAVPVQEAGDASLLSVPSGTSGAVLLDPLAPATSLAPPSASPLRSTTGLALDSLDPWAFSSSSSSAPLAAAAPTAAPSYGLSLDPSEGEDAFGLSSFGLGAFDLGLVGLGADGLGLGDDFGLLSGGSAGGVGMGAGGAAGDFGNIAGPSAFVPSGANGLGFFAAGQNGLGNGGGALGNGWRDSGTAGANGAPRAQGMSDAESAAAYWGTRGDAW